LPATFCRDDNRGTELERLSQLIRHGFPET
jgi:hypothetical protein